MSRDRRESNGLRPLTYIQKITKMYPLKYTIIGEHAPSSLHKMDLNRTSPYRTASQSVCLQLAHSLAHSRDYKDDKGGPLSKCQRISQSLSLHVSLESPPFFLATAQSIGSPVIEMCERAGLYILRCYRERQMGRSNEEGEKPISEFPGGTKNFFDLLKPPGTQWRVARMF